MRDLLSQGAVHGALLVLPALCALWLRWARCPGWSVLGGAVAGLLLGPAFLGAMRPTTHEQHFVGGVEEQRLVEDIRHERDREIAVRVKAGIDAVAIEELQREYDVRTAEAQRRLSEARWSDQARFRVHTAVLVALTMLGAGRLRVRAGDRRQGVITAVSVGLWSALLPGGLACAALMWFWREPSGPALMTAAALGIGPWVLTRADRAIADQAEFGGAHMLQTAGRVASLIAVPFAAWALFARHGGAGLLWATPFLALPLGWLLPAQSAEETKPSATEHLLTIVLIPALTACLALRIDIFEPLCLWMMVLLVILGGDGRWFGAFLGATLPGGRTSLRTMRLILGSMACGPTQLAIAAIAVQTWIVSGEIALGLLVGAIVIEVTGPARRSVARRLIEAEEELDTFREP